MLVITHTGGLSVDILTFSQETLDSFLLKSQQIHKEAIQKVLERYDKEIYTLIDHKRFFLIRLDERILLSTYGILRFKRRYYFDSFNAEYCYLLDNKLEIPKSTRMTNELILKILDLASIMSYSEVGTHVSDEFALSKSTIWKTINEVLLETHFATNKHKFHKFGKRIKKFYSKWCLSSN